MSDADSPSRLPIAVFLSGSGRTLANLIQHRDEHGLPIDIRLVIGSRSGLRGIEIAEQHHIPTMEIRQNEFPEPEAYSSAMFEPVRESGAEYVVMAGFLKHVLIPADFENRVINIHPSLLPKFGGAGMYGHHVHEAVIAAGESTSGCTVHFVDNVYDNGPVLHQRSCPVMPDDTPDTLAARVFEQECLAMPEAIWKIATV
ncbi:phosphoribosylglycinamide formyltransferase [Neorhodopirellula pilleata]|uniref:Phosphoribosylglycinamide formyltransferase n=1 Tax=Neorhodopirellula pilleata TaxID=2714738 RepID=A0A5C6ADG5_9BACT|nr:phosphoribosylglycinamide formyltransferase [Neorhodopirellula pilleata]TWT97480.1 Phosphoribosylglycinamide formyltransferase [Neorhodopirellula pilleata]